MPHFGNCQQSVLDEKHVGKTIKLQERLLNNINFFLEKSPDPTGLLKDQDFVEIMIRMISAKAAFRPNLSEVLYCQFLEVNKEEDDCSDEHQPSTPPPLLQKFKKALAKNLL